MNRIQLVAGHATSKLHNYYHRSSIPEYDPDQDRDHQTLIRRHHKPTLDIVVLLCEQDQEEDRLLEI
jgi:hypothetical protein